MIKDTNKTKVIFRFWHLGQNVIAIFPELPGTHRVNTCYSYENTGQHSPCEPDSIIQNSRPANDYEYNDLKKELESNFGYNFEVIKRYTQRHYESRTNALKRTTKINLK